MVACMELVGINNLDSTQQVKKHRHPCSQLEPGKFKKFPEGLGSDKNDFREESEGSDRADTTEVGFQH